jgi:hypothetical protein
MSKCFRENSVENSLLKKLETEKEYVEKTEKEYTKRKFEALIASNNVYDVIQSVYRTLKFKNKEKYEEFKKFVTNMKGPRLEEIFEKAQEENIQFIGEDKYGSRFRIYFVTELDYLKRSK